MNRHISGNVHHYTYYHCTKKKREIFCSQKCLEERRLEEQIIQYLEKVHVPDKIVQWAHRYLTQKAEEEKGGQKTVAKSLQKALDGCMRQLDRLTQMRLRDLLTDEEYLKQKTELLKQARDLEEKLKNPELTTQGWLEPAKQAFLFANQAKNWFLKGNPEEKRKILETVGSNLLLKDRILLIEAQKPFLILEKRLSYASIWGSVDSNRLERDLQELCHKLIAYYASTRETTQNSFPNFPIPYQPKVEYYINLPKRSLQYAYHQTN